MRAFGILTAGAILAVVAVAAAGQEEKRVSTGRQLFETYCSTCHGKSGLGDGVIAKSLKKRPPDLTQFSKAAGGTFPGDQVLKAIEGHERQSSSDMPAWGDAFAKSQDAGAESAASKIRALVDYIESIQIKP